MKNDIWKFAFAFLVGANFSDLFYILKYCNKYVELNIAVCLFIIIFYTYMYFKWGKEEEK